MAEHTVASADEIPDGERRIVTLEGREIGLFNVGGRFYALLNRCTHQGGPLCYGSISGTLVTTAETNWQPEWVQEGEVLRCPWHSLEFNVTTGRCLAYPRVRVRHFPTRVDDAGRIRITV